MFISLKNESSNIFRNAHTGQSDVLEDFFEKKIPGKM